MAILAIPARATAPLKPLDRLDLTAQFVATEIRQHGNPILVTLAIADHDVPLVEADVLDPQPPALAWPGCD